MKIFQFPSGTTKISKNEFTKVFSEYERVEIPGSVLRIDARFDNAETSGFIVKQLVLNKGILSLKLFANSAISVNVPLSLLEIETSAQLPRVLCLPDTFNRLYWHINGVEYLQAHSDSEVRYCFQDSKLKHYVYLGEKISPKQYLFSQIPAGCVIHVESNKMAEKVLKKGGFDVSKVYVVPDALEWKDFPADKLALTMEEYNPESLITSAQIKLQREKSQKAAEKIQQERERNKGKMLREIMLPLVNDYLSDKDLEYKISKEVREGVLDIQFQFSKDLYMRAGIQSECPEESLGQIVDAALKVRDLYTRYQADIASLHICVRESCGFDHDCPYMSIPLANKVFVTGKMRIESIAADAAAIISVANDLRIILDDSASIAMSLIITNIERLWL